MEFWSNGVMDRMSSDAALRFLLFAHCALWPSPFTLVIWPVITS